jgi:DNA topoisomerase-2
MTDISKKYQKLSQREHVLVRPGMYIGSIKNDEYENWIYNNEENKIIKKTIYYVPALYKIFDEILVNALDHITRLKNEKGDKVNYVKDIIIEINDDDSISVYNSGDGLDIIKHEEHDIYIPELVFGNLLTSTNYDDESERIIGGLNGLGSKACNIFSKKFIVETVDAKRKLYYYQEFKDNMSIKTEPEIKKYSKYPYTKITFLPDYEKFGIIGLTDDTKNLFYKRSYDLAGLTPESIKISLNDKKLNLKNLEKYSELYLGDRNKIYEKVNDRWELIISYSETGFECISFVNGIFTNKGGKHVDHILTHLTKNLLEALTKKFKDIIFKPQHIKDNLFLFVNSTIVNPTFDSQVKDCLTTPIKSFGSKCDISKQLITKIINSELAEKIYESATESTNKKLSKTDGKKQSKLKGIPNLEDAIWAGTNKSEQCTLILTEGLSAASMAISGLSIVGREKYGVFPLKGKILNTLDTNEQKIADNTEITALKKIIGLESKKNYKDLKSLRYGSLMLLTDSDVDGSHISGLLMNLVNSMWPSLIIHDGFLTTMLTPILKLKKGKKEIQFYNINDYEDWEKINDSKGWELKYYKGLGTSTDKEAKEYFKEMKQITYIWDNEESKESLDLAFNKKRADDRKQWLYNYDKKNTLDYKQTQITYSDFINKELIHFSNYNLERAIPSICDGLKLSTRKILYCCFKRKLTKELRVAQLAGYCSEHSNYHHGETSLQEAIIGMAQNFIGSNNINLLQPIGQFGTRIHSCGSDHASARYLNTALTPITHIIFNPIDNNILNYLDEDGYKIEPEFYMPIIPMILINGALGIGTGFSSTIPCYNPEDILKILREMLDAETSDIDLEDIKPWYQSFTGRIVKIKSTLYSIGNYKLITSNKVEITELPIGTWTQDYKEFLEKYMEKNPKILRDYENYSTESKIRFVLDFYPGQIASNNLLKLDNISGLMKIEKEFKLATSKSLSISNMHIYSAKGNIIKCNSAIEIIKLFYDLRIEYYDKRKIYLIKELEDEILYLDAKIRFILDIIDDKLHVSNNTKSNIETYLQDNLYPLIDAKFDYLIKMPIYNLTYEKKEELLSEVNKKKDMLVNIKQTTVETMWKNDLNDFEKNYISFVKSREKGL